MSLRAVYADNVIGRYAFVRDVVDSRYGAVLPVYLGSFIVQKGWTLDITGVMSSVGGRKIIIADEISVYTDADGKEFEVPFPFRAGGQWPYIQDAATGMSVMDSGPIPPVPDPDPEPPQTLTASPGTIAYAKINGGQNELTGKVVTAVYHASDGSVSFFYIQENFVGSKGIKVTPTVAIPVEPGNLVDVTGSVTVTSGEAEIIATSVKCVGSTTRPGPAGMMNKATAAGEFGEQPALYLKTSDSAAADGLSAVGTRVRVWGDILSSAAESGHAVRYIDDGSGLATTSNQGLKVVYWNPNDAPTGQTYIEGVTGILGAEIADGKPIPIVRVPDSTLDGMSGCVKYVKPGGTGDGSSWANAFGSVQSAINAAAASGFEVWVAGSVTPYYEAITLADGVAVYGGFAGTETLREERNWAAHETILDGTGLDSTVVTISSCTSSSTRIDGFTIRNATSWWVGGGVWCDASNSVVANDKITNNYSDWGGGGICCSGGIPLIWNNTITQNTAYVSGGGIYCDGGAAMILNNNISNNAGGGVMCGNETTAQISSNTISDNTYGGGISVSSSSPTISQNTISGNNAYYGGGINCQYNSPGNLVRMTSNVIIDNTCQISGAGIYSDYQSCDIINNTIAWNGDQVYNTGDGICLIGTSAEYKIINNIVANNYGAGIRGVNGISRTLENNDVFGQSSNYIDLGTIPASNISVDPAFVNAANRNLHITSSSPCYNTGLNNAVSVGDRDMDGEARIMDNVVDIGADEVTGCIGHTLTISPENSWAITGSVAHIKATVRDGLTCQPVCGVRVDFTIDTGQITSFYSAGVIDQSELTGYGYTDSNGDVVANILRITTGQVNASIAIDQCEGELTNHTQITYYACDYSQNYSLSFTPTRPSALVGTTAHLQLTVNDLLSGNAVSGVPVDFSVDAGRITQVSQGCVDASGDGGYGITDVDGKINICITRSTVGNVILSAVIPQCNGQLTKQIQASFVVQRHVGFLYDLCRSDGTPLINNNIDAYLTRISQKYIDVIYDRASIESGIDDFNVIFVAMPKTSLNPSGLGALNTFVQTSKDKRIILIGEYNPTFAVNNNYLNSIAQAVGMTIRFSTGVNCYDAGINISRLCMINEDHYLMQGIANPGLWMAATDKFQDGWEEYARPLAYVYYFSQQIPPVLKPWILEEDTAMAGSRIAIHDSCLMLVDYDDRNDVMTNKNFGFVHNLCTMFSDN